VNISEPSRLAYGLLSNAEADFGSAVGAGIKWMAKCITLANTDTVARTITLKIVPSGDTSGDQHIIIPGVTIEAKSVFIVEGLWNLHAGDKFRAFADAANKIAARVDGATVTPV
jgi:hypothetical protein